LSLHPSASEGQAAFAAYQTGWRQRAGFLYQGYGGHGPDYLDIFSDQSRHKKKGRRDQIDYAVCSKEAALLYLINLGASTSILGSSRITSPQEPDFISIDLDPSDEDFGKAIRTAQAAKKIFDQYQLQSLVKTSGKTGIHLFLPCQGFSFPEARTLAEKICELVCKEVPDIATTEVSIEHRGSKLFVDPARTIMPIHWPALTPYDLISTPPLVHRWTGKRLRPNWTPGNLQWIQFRNAWRRKATSF
jgi:DNA primase